MYMKITITGRQIALVLVIVAIAYFLRQRVNAGAFAAVSVGAGENAWTVYGTMQCGWTRKQLDYMKRKNVPYTFVDCANGGGCAGKSAFPTLVSPNGEELVGYNEV